MKKNKILDYKIKNKIFFYNKIGLNKKKNSFLLKKRHFNILKLNLKKNLALVQLRLKFNNFYNKLKTYKNYRNILGYPSRGQRTRTNAKTKKKLFKKKIIRKI